MFPRVDLKRGLYYADCQWGVSGDQLFNSRVLHSAIRKYYPAGRKSYDRATGGSITVRESINNTQGVGIYVVAFTEFGRQSSE